MQQKLFQGKTVKSTLMLQDPGRDTDDANNSRAPSPPTNIQNICPGSTSSMSSLSSPINRPVLKSPLQAQNTNVDVEQPDKTLKSKEQHDKNPDANSGEPADDERMDVQKDDFYSGAQ